MQSKLDNIQVLVFVDGVPQKLLSGRAFLDSYGQKPEPPKPEPFYTKIAERGGHDIVAYPQNGKTFVVEIAQKKPYVQLVARGSNSLSSMSVVLERPFPKVDITLNETANYGFSEPADFQKPDGFRIRYYEKDKRRYYENSPGADELLPTDGSGEGDIDWRPDPGPEPNITDVRANPNEKDSIVFVPQPPIMLP